MGVRSSQLYWVRRLVLDILAEMGWVMGVRINEPKMGWGVVVVVVIVGSFVVGE